MLINSSLILNTQEVNAASAEENAQANAKLCKESLPEDYPQQCLNQGYECFCILCRFSDSGIGEKEGR